VDKFLLVLQLTDIAHFVNAVCGPLLASKMYPGHYCSLFVGYQSSVLVMKPEM